MTETAAPTIAPQLVERLGRLGFRDPVAGPARPGRNLVTTVDAYGRDGAVSRLIVKEGAGRDETGEGTLLSEGLFHREVAPNLGPRVHVARALAHDRAENWLIFERLQGEAIGTDALHALGAAAEQARVWHEITAEALPVARLLNATLGHGMPIGPGLTERDVIELGKAERVVLSTLYRDRPLMRALRGATFAWQTGRLIHGDLTLDNLLETDAGVAVLDWELVRLGDPAADLGALLGSWLDLHLDEERPTTDQVNAADTMAAVHDVWVHIARAYGISSPREPVAGRAIVYAGAHLLRRVIARVRAADAIGPVDPVRFALGRQLATRPGAALTGAQAA